MGVSSWVAWLIVIALTIALLRPHNCSLSDVPSEEVVSAAKDIIALGESYGMLKGKCIDKVKWYLHNDTDMIERRWRVYMITQTFK